MQHLRIIAPAEHTDDVLAVLDATVGTTHVTVQRGVARRPTGDVVTCDVAREAVDELLGSLRAVGLADEGAICVHNVDLSLSKYADKAEDAAPGEGADAVVWESVTDLTHEESTLSVTFLAFLTVATMIAACGVVLDSAILVVGAMAVGPEFGPIAGLCVALVRRSVSLAWRSLVCLIVGFPFAMALTAAFSLLMDALNLFHETDITGSRPATEFIWQPDAFSFVVALLAGVAGVLSLTSAKSGALVGVAISVTTVPAAANAAVAFSYGDFGQMRGSAEQLGLNLLGIVVAGVLTLLAQKAFWAWQRSRTPVTAAPAQER